jgi:hypothetical protein
LGPSGFFAAFCCTWKRSQRAPLMKSCARRSPTACA